MKSFVARIVAAAIVLSGASFRLEATGYAQSTFYVSTTGSDTNPGTDAQPFLTIQKGVSSVAPGDAIIVRDGTYTAPPSAGCSAGAGFMVTMDRSGSQSSSITLKAEHKWGAILDAQSVCGEAINLGASQFWNIEDFDVRNAYWVGIGVYSGASDITIKGNTFHDIGRRDETSTYGIGGVYAAGGSDRITLDGNVFHGIGRTGGKYVGTNDHGLYLHSTNTIITNNTFYEPIEGFGIQTAAGFSGNIANNTLHGPNPYGYVGLIVLWDANGEVTVQNNIFYAPAVAAIHQYRWSSTECSITNNIVYGTDTLSDAGLAACTQTSNLMNADPLFVDLVHHDYHLRCGSPATDAGVPLSYVSMDFDGADRPQGPAYDIGADEAACCGNGVVDGTEACDDGNLVDGDGCDSNCTVTGCGNGIVTAGEACDDGATAAGDCCSSLCMFEANGSPCDDHHVCTFTDRCDGAGICRGTAALDPACLVPEPGSGRSKLSMSGGGSLPSRLAWRWAKGPEITLGMFGDPTAGDDYALCVFADDGSTSRLVLGAVAPAGSAWTSSGGKGFEYSNAHLASAGLKQIQLVTGAAGHAKIKAKGQGSALALSGLGFGPSTVVTTELRNTATGACFGATYTSPFHVDDPDRFQDMSD